jgi:hypothetical protein
MPVKQKLDGMIVEEKNGEVVVNLRTVKSSNVESVAWPTSGEPLMIVRYRSGFVYGYLGVSRQRAVAAAHAPSTGEYINRAIKPYFKAVKLFA